VPSGVAMTVSRMETPITGDARTGRLADAAAGYRANRSPRQRPAMPPIAAWRARCWALAEIGARAIAAATAATMDRGPHLALLARPGSLYSRLGGQQSAALGPTGHSLAALVQATRLCRQKNRYGRSGRATSARSKRSKFFFSALEPNMDCLVIAARVEAGMTPIPPLFLSHPQTRPRLPAGFFFIPRRHQVWDFR
jgi:hypothetical protein